MSYLVWLPGCLGGRTVPYRAIWGYVRDRRGGRLMPTQWVYLCPVFAFWRHILSLQSVYWVIFGASPWNRFCALFLCTC